MGRRKKIGGLGLILLPLHLACSPAATTQGAAQAASDPPDAPPTREASNSDRELDERPRPDVLYAAHAAVPAPKESCRIGAPLPATQRCPEARADLAEALSLEEAPRDTALVALESCDLFEPGLIRALRADLGPAECADQLVVAIVGEQATKSGASQPLASDLREALVGLGLAARLRRLAGEPPQAPAEHDKEHLASYYANELFPWIEKQASAIYAMASQGKELHGYGKGLVAIEAGNADMRFVEIARNAPIAKEIAEYQEAKDLYYATLDEQLEPRKGRGSAAALVGMREFSNLGIRESERVDSARALLSRAYGGRRINALDTLIVPAVPPQKANDEKSAIASRVPTVYATALVGTAQPTPELLRAHLQMGMTTALRRAVESGDDVPAASQLYLARALFEQGRTYFRAQDFQDAHQILNRVLDVTVDAPGEPPSAGLDSAQRDEAVLLRALCVALLAGPKDAAEMIARGPRFADALGNLALLDSLAEGRTELAGRAGFDAAYLRELVVQPGDPEAWRDLQQRYARASTVLKGDEARWARDRAKACGAIEKTVREELAREKKN